MNKNEEFVKSLYDELDEQINDTYKKKKESRDELLKAIAMILLTYTIVDNVLSLSEKDYNKEYSLLGALIIKLTRGNIKQEISNTTSILRNVIKNTYNHYSYNYNLKDVKKIIDSNFKGKHFSDRIWNNEKEVAKKLHKQCQDFLKGKINVNQIQSEIKKTYNTSAYNAKRLAETEVSRCHNKAFDRFCREVGVKKVRYNAIFDKRTCSECADYDGEVFDFNKKLDLPMHPLCRCFYEIADDNCNDNKPVIKELTDDELLAINRYISSDSYKINEKLRYDLDLTDEDEKFIKDLDSALDKMPIYKGEVSRSLEFYDVEELKIFLDKYKIGDIVNYKGYTSTTNGETYNSDGQVQIFIKSITGRDISNVNKSESEILYKRNTKFKVVDVQEINKVVYIFLMEV